MTVAALQNHMRLQALLAAGLIASARAGIVTSYDPNAYAVKVKIQPSDIETGWLPVMTAWAGNGFGFYCGPALGDQALIVFLDGSIEQGVCVGFLPSDEDRPPPVPAGEAWALSDSGAYLKFRPGGVIEMKAPGGLNIEADTKITGKLDVSGDITDRTPGNDVTVKALRDAYNSHKHSGVQSGASLTATTDHPAT